MLLGPAIMDNAVFTAAEYFSSRRLMISNVKSSSAESSNKTDVTNRCNCEDADGKCLASAILTTELSHPKVSYGTTFERDDWS